ncbi:MAG: hypothetical protein ACRD2I_07680 [Vicinamibacterales bacterium]
MSRADADSEQSAVLWQFGPLVCSSLTRSDDPLIEVRLTSGDVIISAEFFTESDAALKYAIEKLRSYNNDRSLIEAPLPPDEMWSPRKTRSDPF